MITQTIYQRMAAIFNAAGIPGFLQEWQKTEAYPVIPDKFAAYIVPLENDAMCADDHEIMRRTEVIVHLYGRTDVGAEKETLRTAFKNAGFMIPRIRDLDDVRNGEYQYHKRFDLVLIEEV